MSGTSESFAMLTIRDSLPNGLLDCRASQIGDVLGGPTLIELGGQREAPLFVSILIHGNEDVGLGAIQRVLKARLEQALPRSLMLFIGNVAAAAQGQRRLDGQPDYNRIWPGAVDDHETPDAQMMAQLHDRVVARRAFAAIDLHNNTGRNPHYSVVCSKSPSAIGLASLFTDRAVLFRGLPGTQTASFSNLVPAMTAECGKPRSAENERAAAAFVNRVLELDHLPTEPELREPLQLFHTLGVVRVRPEITLGFGDAGAELNLDPHLDRLNFMQVLPDRVLGHTQHPAPIEVIDEDGHDVAESFFSLTNGELRLRREVTPAMFTVDERIVRQDCLGYLMETLDHL